MRQHTQAKRLEAERELDWYYNVFPTRIGLSALDPSSVVTAGVYTGYTDVQIAAIERSVPIHRALCQLSGREQKVLRLGFTAQCWRAEVDHRGVSAHYDLETFYGSLTGLVRHLRFEGTREEKRAKADALLARVLLKFVALI